MSNTRNTGFLTNVVKYTDKGDISFVSGSTTLMSISSSGAVTVTGVISGSNALTSSYSQNSELLDNLDSTSFVFTSSFNTYSSSMSTRVGKIEGNYATTGSNVFLGAQTVCANITSTGTIIAQTLNVQQVTSSVVYSSGSNVFGCSLTNTQQFTGSVTMTGSLNVAGNTCVVSICSPAHIGGTFSGTTGTFSGQISQTLGDNQILYTNTSATTGYQYMRMVSTGAQLTWGIDANPSAGLLTNSLANSAVIGNSKNAPFHIGTNAIVRFTVDCNGVSTFTCQVCVPNIISTGASGGRYATFNAPTNGGYITFEAGGTAFGDLGSYCAQYGTGDATTLLLGSRTGYALALGTNSAERIRITTAGRVGIGNQAPVSALVVSTASDTTSLGQSGIVIEGSSTLTAGCVMALAFTAIPGTTRARAAVGSVVGSDWGKGNLAFYTRDASDSTSLSTTDEKMRITSGGTVLVGTTNADIGGSVAGIAFAPNGRVLASICETGTLCHIFMGDRRGVSNEGPVLMMMRGGYFKSAIGVLGTAGISNDGGITFSTICGNDTISERMRITSVGNVGIGTCTPCGSASERTIHLAGNSSTNATIYVTRDTYARTILGTNASGGITGTQSNHNLYIVTNDTTRLFIDNTGIACFACNVCALNFITTGTALAKDFSYQTNYGSKEIMATGYGGVNTTYCKVFTYSVEDVPFDLTAIHNHYGLATGYGAIFKISGAVGQGGIEYATTINCTSGNGGCWCIYRVCAGYVSVCHFAGSYAGNGYWMIKVSGVYLGAFL